MKPNPPLIIERRLARYDRRAGSRRAFSKAHCLFRPVADANVRPIAPRADAPSRSAFRTMSAEMLAGSGRRTSIEMIVFALIAAIIVWPLLSLLLLLAETVPG